MSTYSSAKIGIFLPTNGRTTFLPIRFLYLSSSGFTAIAMSPNIVSGLVVATMTKSFESSIGYFICQSRPSFSCLITSRSETAVFSDGSQLTSLYPLYILFFLCNSTNAFITASLHPSSRVNLYLFQSTEHPSLLICDVIFSSE